MRLELEWRIPWPAEWDKKKKIAAGQRLVEYMSKGTFYETKNRLRVERVGVIVPQSDNEPPDPYISLVLEN